jgi:isocitrate dehydrogenase (NAD+)
MEKHIQTAAEHFAKLIASQLKRVDEMASQPDFIDYSKLDKLIIGVCGGDGIGPAITAAARSALEELLRGEAVEFRDITGLTIENRVKAGKAIPDDVLAELKACHVILKGPTTTPQAGDAWPNIESANVKMRKELDLFANVRPVKVPELEIDWVFFRENTEGAYAVGSQGVHVTPDLSIDFTVTTSGGTERIVRQAFEYAKKTGRRRVTAVTKANVVKATDGKFLSIFKEIAAGYPGIAYDDWYIDIMTAKLLDEKRRTGFDVLVMPNLYGDILTDEAAELQGGVGTAGSANIGKRYAMFEAIHGSAPRMVEEGRAQYADPSSMLRASVLLLEHIGKTEKARLLERALDICSVQERRLTVTGRDTGCTGLEFADYVLKTVASLIKAGG